MGTNVNPRGLYGWPREGSGQTPLPASEVWVALANGTWCAATEVYEWCVTAAAPNGAWMPVWASGTTLTNPTAVTATQVGGKATGHIDVRVSWTLPSQVFANAWRVYRPDGTVVGDTADATVLTLTDTDPRPTPTGGKYKVVPILGPSLGTGTQSNTITLGAAPLVSTATMNQANNRVDLVAQVSPDTFTSVELWRVGEGAAWWSGAPWAAGQSVWYDGSYPPGATVTYQLCSVVNGRRGGCTNWSAVNTTPGVSRPQSVTLVGCSGTARLTFYGPASGGADDYQVQAYMPQYSGSWVDLGHGHTSGVVDLNTTPYGTITSVSFRVRTRRQGIYSDWATTGSINPYCAPPKQQVTSCSRNWQSNPVTISLAWAAAEMGGGPVSSFEIWVYDHGTGGPWRIQATIPAGNAAFSFMWTQNTSATVLVRAVGPGGTSADSNQCYTG